MYDHHFSNLSRPSVPDDLCKDSAPKHPRFWRGRFLKVFTIYGHSGLLGQWTATILAIFCFLNLRRLHMKFEQDWPRGFRGEVVWISKHFSHTNVRYPYKCIGKQTWPRRKKVKRQCTTNILAILVELSSPIICAKIQPQGILCLWRRRFLKFTIYGHGGHLSQRTATILAFCFRFPNLRRLHMKIEQHWLRGFSGEDVWKSKHFSHTNVWCSYKCIGKQTWPRCKKVKRQCTKIILAILVDLLSPMICAKIQPQGVLCSGEEDF